MFFLKSCTLGTQYICTVIYTSLCICICMYSECGLVIDHSMCPPPRELILPSAATEGPNMLQTCLPNNPRKDVFKNVV